MASGTVTVAFASMRPFSQPFAMQLLQKEYQHDVALLSIYNDNPDAKRYVSGTPLQIVYGFPRKLRTFYGYVNHVQQRQSSGAQSREEQNSSVVFCVGASFWMKDSANNAWNNQTASQVATALAAKFRLSSSIEPHSKVWPTLMQSGQSYWAFLVEWAEKIGYVVYCTGIQLHFHTRSTSPNSLTGSVPVLDVNDTGRVKSFHLTVGGESPTGGRLAKRQYSGLDPVSMQVYTLVDAGAPAGTTLAPNTVSPLFTEMQPSMVGIQMDEAKAKLSGKAQANQLFISAEALLVGDASITQGMLVYVANASGGQSGLWYVTEAEHRFDHGQYLTRVCLGRESLGSTPAVNFAQTQPTQPSGRLAGPIWVAA